MDREWRRATSHVPVKAEEGNLDAFLPLSNADFHILLAIADGERHGYAIMQDVQQTTEGAIRLGRGTLYRCIRYLLRNALLEESARHPAAHEDQRRRYYRFAPLRPRVIRAQSRRCA